MTKRRKARAGLGWGWDISLIKDQKSSSFDTSMKYFTSPSSFTQVPSKVPSKFTDRPLGLKWD